MPIPDSMDDLSTTINSNSPAGTETPGNGDDYIRALSAIVRRTNAKGSDIASAATTDIGAATAEFVDVTGTTTITALGTIAEGIVRTVRFTGALTLTHNATSLILPGAANITTAANDRAVFRSLGSGNWLCVVYVKANGTPVTLGLSALTEAAPSLDDYVAITDTSDSNNAKKSQLSDVLGLLRGYIDGLTLSTAGASATMSIAAGVASDSTNTELIQLAASISKTTSAWAVGTAQGGLDTGTIANSTRYYFYLIRRPDTGVVDVVFSTNSSAPTLPANYTQYRYIGSRTTNGSAQWTGFTQNGNYFMEHAPITDISVANLGTTRTSYTLSVPQGRRCVPVATFVLASATNASLILLTPDADDTAPSFNSGDNYQAVNAGSNSGTLPTILTNTSGQITARSNLANTTLRLRLLGYIDFRDAH